MEQDQKKKIKGIPDIVICLDVTGSMGECLEQLKSHLGEFIAELEKPLDVQDGLVGQVTDWRIRLLPFRDLDADAGDGICPAMVDDLPFCTTAAEFASQLEDSRCKASGGGDEPESALDAIHRAAKKTEWRPSTEAHRFVILFTDATTKPTLHASTAQGGPTDVQEVKQALQTEFIKLVLFAPKTPEFEQLYANPSRAQIAKDYPLFETRADAVKFFKMEGEEAKDRFAKILFSLARTITVESSEEL